MEGRNPETEQNQGILAGLTKKEVGAVDLTDPETLALEEAVKEGRKWETKLEEKTSGSWWVQLFKDYPSSKTPKTDLEEIIKKQLGETVIYVRVGTAGGHRTVDLNLPLESGETEKKSIYISEYSGSSDPEGTVTISYWKGSHAKERQIPVDYDENRKLIYDRKYT